MLKNYLLIAFLIFFICRSSAQEIAPPLSDIHFQKIDSGLFLYSMIQDSDGFLWFASQTGLTTRQSFKNKGWTIMVLWRKNTFF